MKYNIKIKYWTTICLEQKIILICPGSTPEDLFIIFPSLAAKVGAMAGAATEVTSHQTGEQKASKSFCPPIQCESPLQRAWEPHGRK